MNFRAGIVVVGLAALAGCGSSSTTVTPSGTIEDNFFVTWEIHSAALGPVDCQTANAPGVDLDAVNLDTGERHIFHFACTAYQGTAGPISVGHFDVLLNLVDPTGGVISQTDIGAENISTAGTIDLGHVVFTAP